MATFQSITDIQQDPAIPLTTFTLDGASVQRGPYLPASAPFSSTLSYEPIVEHVEKSPVNSNGNWEEIRKRGSIVMSPYYHRRTLTRNYVVGVPEISWVNPNPFAWIVAPLPPTPPYCGIKEPWKSLFTRWTEQGDSRYWSSDKLVYINALNSMEDGLGEAVATSQTSVMAAFKGGFDALTQAAESREALSYFEAKTDEARDVFSKLQGSANNETRSAVKQGFNARQLMNHADRHTRAWGRKWMEYRYAIMPLVYAYKDVKDLYENAGRTYKTFKSKERLDLSADLPSGLPIQQIIQRSSGTIDVTSTIVAGYAPSGLNSFVASQLQSNIFATAWELVPLSFVIDWFVNVGDYIVAKTSPGLALQMQGCTAIRKRVLLEEYLHDFRVTNLSFNSGLTNACYPSPVVRTHTHTRSVMSHLKTVEFDHYDRVLFNTQDLSLSLQNDPFGNWRRLVDGAVLSYSPLKKLLRSFK